MNVRRATTSDEAVIRGLWEAFEAELPEPQGFAQASWEDEWPTLCENMAAAGVYLAEEGAEPLGMLDASSAPAGRWHIETVYVRPDSRGLGVASALMRECALGARARGASYVTLEVLATNHAAERVWRGLGFETVEFLLGQPLEALERRLGVEL